MDNYSFAQLVAQNGGDVAAALQQSQGMDTQDPSLVALQSEQTINDPITALQNSAPTQADLNQEYAARMAGGRPPSNVAPLPTDYVNPLIRVNPGIASLYNRPDPNAPPAPAYLPNPEAQVPTTDPNAIPPLTKTGVPTDSITQPMARANAIVQSHATQMAPLNQEIDSGREKILNAYKAQKDLEAQNATDLVGVLDERQQAEARVMAQEQANTKAANDYAKVQRDNWQQKQNEFFNSHIDPEAFWKDEKGDTNWGKTILGTIAIALGTFASALPAQMGGGGPNVAKQIIDAAIDRNMEAQKINMSKMGRGVDMAQNSYKMALDQVGDAKSAELMARNVEIEKTKQAIQNYSALIASPNIKAGSDLTMAQLDHDLKQNDAEIHSRLSNQEADRMYKKAETAKAYTEIARANQPGQSMIIPGAKLLNPGVQPTAEQTKSFMELDSNTRNVLSALDEAEKYRNENSADVRTIVPGVPGKLQGRQLASNVNRAYIQFLGTGGKGGRIPQDPTQQAKQGLLPADLGLVGRGTVADIKEARKRVISEARRRAAAFNYTY